MPLEDFSQMWKRWFSLIISIFMILGCTACQTRPLIANDVQAQRELRIAVQNGNLEEIREAAKKVNDINNLCLDGTQWNPIIENIDITGDYRLPVVKCLLDCGVDVNSADEKGCTLLMYATIGYPYPRMELIDLLLERDANVNQRDKDGFTVLDYVDQGVFGDGDSFFKLLDHGALVDQKTFSIAFYGMPENAEYEKQTGVYQRRYQYRVLERLAEILKEQGIPLELPETLEAAILHDDERFLSCYSNEWQTLTEEDKKTVFFFTAYSGRLETFQKLLEDPALTLDTLDGRQQSLLTVAAKGGNVDVLTYLLSAKSWEEQALSSAAMYAVHESKSAGLQVLLDYGAVKFPNTPAQGFNDALRSDLAAWMIVPVKTGDRAMMQQLFDAGYPINEVTAWEIMKLAAQYGQLEIIQDMLDMGYSIEDAQLAERFQQQTILYQACNYSQMDIVQWLVNHGADPSEETDCLWIASYQNNLDLCTYLVEHGANPYTSWGEPSWGPPESFTAVYNAERFGYTEMKEYFNSLKS